MKIHCTHGCNKGKHSHWSKYLIPGFVLVGLLVTPGNGFCQKKIAVHRWSVCKFDRLSLTTRYLFFVVFVWLSDLNFCRIS